MKAIIVNVTSYTDIGSIGAEHYYGKLYIVEINTTLRALGKNPFGYESSDDGQELVRGIDAKEANYLSRKDGGKKWKSGDITGRFNTIDEIKLAIQKFIDDNQFDGSAIIVRNWEPIKDDTRIIFDPKTLKEESEYLASAVNRTTGRKIKIICCISNAPAAKNLPIGDVVNELKMTELEDENPNRGVWVWGNGEPIKLVNDLGPTEYEVIPEDTAEGILDAIFVTLDVRPNSITKLETKDILDVINDLDVNENEIANIICETTGIQKRGNRSLIREMLIRVRNKE